MPQRITLNVNGQVQTVTVNDGSMPLLWFLDDGIETQTGCGASCGACTVLVDGCPAKSCDVNVLYAVGKKVVTIKGLLTDLQGIVRGLKGSFRNTLFKDEFLKGDHGCRNN